MSRSLLAALALVAALAPIALGRASAQEEPSAEPADPKSAMVPDSSRVESLPEGDGVDTGELGILLGQAEEIFYSARQPEALEPLGRLIDLLSPRASELRGDDRRILVRALALRAEARFNLGESEAAASDLTRLLRIDPAATLDPEAVSPKFFGLLEGRRSEMVGELVLTLSPADAMITLGDRRQEAWRGAAPVLAGEYRVRLEKPGYRPLELQVVVPAGASALLEATLERTAAVLRLATRPAGIEIWVDGQMAGTTEAAEATVEGAEAPLSGPFIIDGLATGVHELELRRPGYRSRQVRVELDKLADFTLDPLDLEPARGKVTFSGLPDGATLFVNGRESAIGAGRDLLLPPGEYRFEARYPTVGSFERELRLDDRDEVTVEVELEPSLALLGVVAPTAEGARLHRALENSLGSLPGWLYLDRREAGARIFAELGAVAADLPRIASGEVSLSWHDLQRAFDREITASLYVVALLGDDSPGIEADIWLWCPAPGPAEPSRWTPSDAEPRTLEPLAAALGRPLRLTTAGIGARLLDSPVEPGPVVATIEPGGPAAAAALQIGDVLQEVAGQAVTTRLEAIERLEEWAASPEAVEISVRSADATRKLAIFVAASPLMPWPNRAGPEAPISRALLRLELALARSDHPAWLPRLHEAALLLGHQQWLQAADTLRAIEAPDRAGLGKGTVDYWLGVALAAADPASEPARQAFERAALADRATLHSDDGPRVAPRARARLER